MSEEKKEFGLDDYADLEGSLRFDEDGGGEGPQMKMADISWVKRKFLDVPYGNLSKMQVFDLYLPDEGDGPFPVILHMHGGGFGMGDKRDDHMDTYLKLLQYGYAVGSVEYRLSGEAIFPAGFLDVREAFRFIKRNAADYKIDPDRICALGGSSGGNFAALMAMNIPNGEFYGEEGLTFDGDCTVKAAVDQFGPIDFRKLDDDARENGVSFVDHDTPQSAESSYMGGPLPTLTDEWLAKASPATYINEAMAPLLVQHGTVDKLVPFMQSARFVNEIYQKLGPGRVEFVPMPGADHEGPDFSSDWNLKILRAWLDENLKK